jgi:hypothetical protein
MCAECVEEFTGIRKIGHGSIPSTIERLDVSPVGNYALNFSWSDGHQTGIYDFEYLRKLCPCSQCLPGGLTEPPETVPNPGSFEVWPGRAASSVAFFSHIPRVIIFAFF